MLSFIFAPAGFGKITLVGEWLAVKGFNPSALASLLPTPMMAYGRALTRGPPPLLTGMVSHLEVSAT